MSGSYGHYGPHGPHGHPGAGPGGYGPGGPGQPYPKYIPPGYVYPGHGHQGVPVFGPPGFGPLPTARFSHGRHRLHWATGVLRALAVVGLYMVFLIFGLSLLEAQASSGGEVVITPVAVQRFALVTGAVVLAAPIAGLWAWLSPRFWLSTGGGPEGQGGGRNEDDLMVETGILRRRRRRIPLSRVQAVDVVRPLVSRALGLAEVRVELAGGDEAAISLRYLGRTPAQQLRAELLARAAGLPGYTPEAPERPLWRVRQGTLFGSLTLKLPVIGAAVLFTVLIAVGITFHEPGVLGGAVPVLLGLLRAVVAPLIVYGSFRAAMSPDGVRLRYGLLETRMQTVPPGRVQAVRVVEPLLWRSYGWARVDVTVAGYVGERQVLSSVLLPVAPREVAMRLVADIFPGANVPAVRLSPSSAKAFWSQAEAGSDDHVFVTRRGLLCRRLDVIAHARAQSVHLVSGPLQWLLGIGTVHIAAPPGPVQVAAVDRDLGEARVILESTAERARRARAVDKGPGRWAADQGPSTSP